MATFDDMALEGKITVYDKGFDQAVELVRRVHHALGRHLEPAAVQRRAVADRDRALRAVASARARADLGRRRRAARRARAGGAAAARSTRRVATGTARPSGARVSTYELKVRAFKAIRRAAGPRRPAGRAEDVLQPDPRPRGAAARRAGSVAARCAGIDFDLDEQVAWIERNVAHAMREFAPPEVATDDPAEYSLDNASYGRVGADILHGVVRGLKPRRIVELGSGHSTLIMAAAAERNRMRASRPSCGRSIRTRASRSRGSRARLSRGRHGRRMCRSRSSRRWATATCCSWTQRTRSSSAQT